jgi:hypothetical protein
MKPKPLESLNHFTTPVLVVAILVSLIHEKKIEDGLYAQDARTIKTHQPGRSLRTPNPRCQSRTRKGDLTDYQELRA